MKRIFAIFVVCIIAVSFVLPASAADGKVTYSGNAGSFVFAPGSEHSLTDLFSDFKGVMPGDSLTQKITVKNHADNKVKVKIYMRALGAHADSVAFLSQLGLQVAKSEENEMAYMFDAAASETAQLADWTYLGTLYSGGQVNLDVTLNVPVELTNEFQSQIGYLDWEFMIEEFPVADTDPKPPQTGDSMHLAVYFAGLGIALAAIIALALYKRKKSEP